MSRIRQSVSAMAAGAAISGAVLLGVDLFHGTQYAAADQTVDARQKLAAVQTPSEIYREVNQAVSPSVVNIQVPRRWRGEGAAIAGNEAILSTVWRRDSAGIQWHGQ